MFKKLFKSVLDIRCLAKNHSATIRTCQLPEKSFQNSARPLVTHNLTFLPATKPNSILTSSENLLSKNLLASSKISCANYSTNGAQSVSAKVQEKISSLQLKKRPTRKKKIVEDESKQPGLYNVVAFATAEEYDLEGLIKGLKEQDLYEPRPVDNASDVVHAVAKYPVDNEPREIFFFEGGSVVLWNISELESSNVLSFLRKYEVDSYSESLVHRESENVSYKYLPEGQTSCVDKEGDFLVASSPDNILDKYAFSNAMVSSVKLGIGEAYLESFVENDIEPITEDLKHGRKIKISREEALRKHGELFSLRTLINLSSNLLDTPDFYWDHDKLEALYNQVCSNFSVNKRTKVLNEKILLCLDLMGLVSSHLNDKHHIRLEWMIIVLIMIEVVFETLHYIERLA